MLLSGLAREQLKSVVKELLDECQLEARDTVPTVSAPHSDAFTDGPIDAMMGEMHRRAERGQLGNERRLLPGFCRKFNCERPSTLRVWNVLQRAADVGAFNERVVQGFVGRDSGFHANSGAPGIAARMAPDRAVMVLEED